MKFWRSRTTLALVLTIAAVLAASAQAALARKNRKSNVEGRFFAGKSEKLDGARLLLLDDILTTL